MKKWLPKFNKNNRGQALLEYIIILICIMAVLVAFRQYIERGFAGRWKAVGDTFGQGRLYDAHGQDVNTVTQWDRLEKTVECAYYFGDHLYTAEDTKWEGWYDLDCFKEKCDCFSIDMTSSSCSGCAYECSITNLGYKCKDAEEEEE